MQLIGSRRLRGQLLGARANGRVQQRFELAPPAVIAEHEAPQCRSIEAAIAGANAGTEALEQRAPAALCPAR